MNSAALQLLYVVRFTHHSEASATLEQTDSVDAGHGDARQPPTFSRSARPKLIRIIVGQNVDVLLQDPWQRRHVAENQLQTCLKQGKWMDSGWTRRGFYQNIVNFNNIKSAAVRTGGGGIKSVTQLLKKQPSLC